MEPKDMSSPINRSLPEHDRLNTSFPTFPAFLSFHDFAARTVTVYTAMARKFVTWLHDECGGKTFIQCTKQDLAKFIAQLGDKRLPLRYAVLIRDMFNYLREKEGFIGENPASALLYEQKVNSQNEKRAFLTQDQRQALIRRIEECEDAEKRPEDPNGLRDAAIVAMMTGGGMRVPTLLSLTVNCAMGRGWVMIVNADFHEAPLQPFAQGVVQAWARTRAGEETLFPPLNHASVFRAVVKFLEGAGIVDSTRDTRIGPQTLRNTYGAILIDQGFNDAQLKMALGLNRLYSACLLRRDYADFQNGGWKIRKPKRVKRES